jgi:hypothetical protein
MSRVVLHLIVALFLMAKLPAATIPSHVTLDINEVPKLELFEALATLCGCGLTADQSVLQQLNGLVSVRFDNTPWSYVLTHINEQMDLDITIDGELLRVVPTNAQSRLVMRMYDLRLLDYEPIHHVAFPLDLEVVLGGHQHPGFLPPDQGRHNPYINEFIEIFQAQVAPQSWSNEGVSIEEYNGYMVVMQTPDVHTQITHYLAMLENMAARQLVCRLYRLSEIPSGTNTVLPAADWSKLVSKLPAPAAVFLTNNNNNQSHFSGIQRSIVVETDQNQSVQAPVVYVLSTGLSVFVKASATITGVRVTGQLWATVSSTLPTTDFKDDQGTSLVTITTPQVVNDYSDDLRDIPHGGAAIYQFGERAYALTVEVLDYSKPVP